MDAVDWQDGLLLTPDIFKQQERYFRWQLYQSISQLSPFYWGFRRLKISDDHLARNTIHIEYAAGIFKDHGYFKLENCQFELDRIQLNDKTTTLYICKDVRSNNISIQPEAPQCGDSLAFCQIKYTNSQYEINRHFIPPCTNLSASSYLLDLINSTCQYIENLDYSELKRELSYLYRESYLHPLRLHEVITKLITPVSDSYQHDDLSNSIANPLISFNKTINSYKEPEHLFFVKSGLYWTISITTDKTINHIDLYIKTKHAITDIYFKFSLAEDIDRIVKLSLRGLLPTQKTQPDHQIYCYRFNTSKITSLDHAKEKNFGLHINDHILDERPWICIDR